MASHRAYATHSVYYAIRHQPEGITMGLGCQGYEIANLRRNSFSGEQGLGHHARLHFGIEMDMNATLSQGPTGAPLPNPVPMKLYSVGGSVTVKTRKRPKVNLGHLYTDRSVWLSTSPQSRKHYLSMFVDLAPEQIEALEESRNGEGGIDFTLSVTALAEHQRDIAQSNDSVLFSINQSDWLDVLTQVGYGDYLLFEIPSSPSASPDTDYLARLREARQHIWLGQYDDAVTDCRNALACHREAKGLTDAITTSERGFCGKKNGAPAEGEGARNAMSKNDRFLFLYRAAKHLTDVPSHPEKKGPQPFTRSQAISILSIVAALLSVGDLGQVGE
ncbi:MAG: hypothetical protein ACYDEV_01340 [Acidiferrobacter sp.]